MSNIRPLLKRVCAYAIDLVIIMILSSLIASLPIFKKEMKEYQKTYEEYEKIYYEHDDYLTLLEESYEDKKINEEEYTKLLENEKFQELISSQYEDNKISKKEYSKIVEEITEKINTISKDYVYLLGTKSISNSIITLVLTLLYFGVIQYFLKGKTIGKKLLKLQVVSANDKKLTVFNYLLRALIVNEVLLNAIGVTFIILASKSVYVQADSIVKTLISIVEAAIIFLVLMREDQRGLHDLLFGTKVISTDIKEETKVSDDKKIIDIEVPEEPKKEMQKKDTKETKNKSKSKEKTTNNKKNKKSGK